MTERTCSVDGCEGFPHARALCKKHYTRLVRHGDALAVRPAPFRQKDAIFCPTGDLCEREPIMDRWCLTMKAHTLTELQRRAVLVDPPTDPLARPVDGPCWIVGTAAVKGYRSIGIGSIRRRVHRVALAASGQTTAGSYGDHLCRNRACCNPAHLEPTTQAENTRRGLTALQRELTPTCRKGHDLTRPDSYWMHEGRRLCKECRRAYRRDQRAKGNTRA